MLALLDRAFAVASKTAAAPVLQNVWLEAYSSDDAPTVKVTGSDSEITMVVQSNQVLIEEEGNALLPSKVHDIVKLCPDSEITIETDEKAATITCLAAFWEIRLESDTYPDIETDHVPVCEIPKDSLQAAITRCRGAISSDAIRAMFLFIQVTGEKMRATDGNRFHQVDFPFPMEAQIPARGVAEILRRLRAMSMENVEIGETDRHYTFKLDEDMLIVTKHTTEYPDVERAILNPSLENDIALQIDRKAMIEVVKRVAITADPDTSYMTLVFNDDTIQLSTLDKFSNQSKEVIDIHWPHPELTVGVNHEHYLGVLSAMSTPQIQMTLKSTGGNNASLGFSEEGFVGVLVQLRQDLGDAAKGSDRVRPAQMDPTGWGFEGSLSDQVHDESGNLKRRGRRARTNGATAVALADDSPELSVSPEDIGAILDE